MDKILGLFGLGNQAKEKKEAHTRALSWWKAQKLMGIKLEARDCTICKKVKIPYNHGFLFEMRHILHNDKFMNHHISLLEKKGIPSDEAQEMVWKKVEKMSHDPEKAQLMICEKCLKFFI